MVTLITLLQALIVSGTIVCVTYCFMHFTAHCVLWLIDVSFAPAEDLYALRPNAPSHLAEDIVGVSGQSAFPI
jgi:hypothetical protein